MAYFNILTRMLKTHFGKEAFKSKSNEKLLEINNHISYTKF